MHYKNLYIRDFGIFSNQNLKDIGENLVVIGGKNRSGKSTFLKLMRYLPYGLPQNNSIPPASNQYYIEAELEKENKKFNLFLNGFSKPEVIDDDQKQHAADELFNHLDQLTYQQLFSISLDELQQLSKIAKGKKKEKRLFSILLGAGFSELVKVPELADKYFNKAQNIGGILGDPTVAAFKPYYNEIKAAEEIRDQALLEIKEFTKKRNELELSQKKLETKKQKIADRENEYFLLDLLKNNYSELEDLEKKKAKLKKAAVNTDNLNQKNNSASRLDNLLSFFKSQAKKIKIQRQKEEVLQEKIKNYELQKNKIADNLQDLVSELESLNSSWKEPLQHLENIKIDLIEEQKLNKMLAEYDKLEAEIERLKAEIENLEFEIEENESELKEIEFKRPDLVLKRSYFVIILAFITLSLSFFIDFNLLRYFSLLIGLVAFVYYSSNYSKSRLKVERVDKIKNENKSKSKKLSDLKLQLDNKLEQLSKLEVDLEKYARILGIENNDYLTLLDSYFREIKDKKRRYKALKIEKKENEIKREEIEKSLQKLRTLIIDVAEYCSLDFSTTAEQKKMEAYQVLFADFKLLSDLFTLSENYISGKSQLEHTLKASDKIKTALNDSKTSRAYYQIFIKLYSDFSSLEAVEKKKSSLSEKLDKLKAEKSELEEKITTLKNRINDLSTSTKIEKAQAEINQAQNNLEKKAQEYAVNKSVHFILKKLRSRIIEKTEKELLNPASKILSRISSHHYTELKTAADLEQSDFKIITEKGQEYNSVKELSRGSLEQLFLAVRISRIKEINPPLPLVLDDSFVNFDRSHLYHTAELIANLASRHQIFILSCHPHLISYISQLTDSAQYWKLEAGEFELSSQQKLIKHLSH
ncbi:MAG: AAA family ATPase [Halanaerobium sp.]